MKQTQQKQVQQQPKTHHSLGAPPNTNALMNTLQNLVNSQQREPVSLQNHLQAYLTNWPAKAEGTSIIEPLLNRKSGGVHKTLEQVLPGKLSPMIKAQTEIVSKQEVDTKNYLAEMMLMRSKVNNSELE
jgi:hypothetical protein